MTLDKSLKVKLGANKNRNVLKRGERLLKLQEAERWQAGNPVIGLPKVRVYKISMKKKKKVKSAEEAAGDKKGGDKKAPAAKGGAKK